LVAASRSQQTELIFTLASDRLGSAAADIGHVLFVTSVMAALISFHNTIGRYAFALGREEVLPAVLGRTTRSGAPAVASGVQSVVGLVVIAVYALAGLDPLVQLFFYCGTAGGIGVLVLLLLTAIAVVRFFTGRTHDAGLYSAYLAPSAAAVALAVVLVLALLNLDVLLGVRPGHPLTWVVPLAIVVILGAGALWAQYLRVRRPDVYAVIGLGPDSAAARATGGVQ
jgi:amino acid transporter